MKPASALFLPLLLVACNNLPGEDLESTETEMAADGLRVTAPRKEARELRGRYQLKSGGFLLFEANARTGALRISDQGGKRLLAFESTAKTHKLVAGDDEFVMEIDKEKLKSIMGTMKGGGPPPEIGEDSVVNMSGNPEQFDTLLRSEAMKELPALSEVLGKKLKVTGKSNPGALMLHRFAMYVAKVNTEASEAPAVSSDGEVTLACVGSNNYVYGNCRNQDDHCRNNCLGMCGEGCKCWDWVCGDCCFHWGCYYHDLRCRKCTWYRPDACFDCYANAVVFIFAFGACGI